jgi:hypothetical protein
MAENEQIGQRRGGEQTVRVLVESAVAHLDEAEDPFDQPMLCSTLARTLDLVRFRAFCASSTTPRYRYRRLVTFAFGAYLRITSP